MIQLSADYHVAFLVLAREAAFRLYGEGHAAGKFLAGYFDQAVTDAARELAALALEGSDDDDDERDDDEGEEAERWSAINACPGDVAARDAL